MRLFYYGSSLLTLLWLVSFFGISHSGLYDPQTDEVASLNTNNFVPSVTGSPKLWFIEFYLSWCGHCIKFAPRWKDLANSVKAWKHYIKVGATDCADDQNVAMCRAYDIKGFPHLAVFYPHSKPNSVGEAYTSSYSSTKILRYNLIDLAVKYYDRTKDPYWLVFSPLKSVDEILKYLLPTHTVIALIVEDRGSYLGKEVILDLGIYPKILVRTMLSEDFPSELHVKKFPVLLILDKKAELTSVTYTNLTAEMSVNFLLNISGYAANITSEPTEDVTSPPAAAAAEHLAVKEQRSKPAAYMQDLLSGIHFMFQQEIAIRKNIRGKLLKSLQNFINVLTKYFPAQSPVTDYLNKVNTWFSRIPYSIAGQSWLDKIELIQSEDPSLPKEVIWVGCVGSKPQYRGYPCSLWTIFHALTVNAYLKNKDGPFSNPTEVLSAISDYITEFFGCEECSRNFRKMSRNISMIHSHKESVLWLWEAHNKVNTRLHKDYSEDPMHPKIQFPSMKMCPECYKPDKEGHDSKLKNHWNRDAVFEFLLNFYSTNLIPISQSSGENSMKIKGAGQRSAFSDNTADSSLSINLDNKTEELDWWENKLAPRDTYREK
ncbi:sulfhydryl oxidase 2-like [Argonauta hians]